MPGMLRRLAGWLTKGYVATQAKDEDEFPWLRPPLSTGDPAAWDQYWNDQVSHALVPPLFDMFCDDSALVAFMARSGLTRVLCAGTGTSQEPRILADAGLRVVALDISPVALQLAQEWVQPEESAQIVDPTLRRSGGAVEYVVGSILDPSLCPGPFDVVIERRTLQIFSSDERQQAVQALARRLGGQGLFVSHCHDAAWRPPAKPLHATESIFRTLGWPILTEAPAEKLETRSAWLVTSTG
jgi:hypothetical protein